MRARAWGWVVLVAGLAGCGGVPEEAAGELSGEGPLGKVRQSGASGGGVAWTRFGTGPGLEVGSVVTQDRDGHVITAVHFTGSADLGRGPVGPGTPEVPGVALAKYSPEGRLLWTRVFHGRAGGLLGVEAVGTDRERNVLLAGSSDTEVGLAPGVKVKGAFLVKLDRHGDVVWHRTLKGDAAFLANGLVTDRAGDVWVSGTLFDGRLDFGGRVLEASGLRGFLAKFAPDGTLRWLHAEAESTLGGGVALDAEGDGYFCGTVPQQWPEDPSTGTRPVLRRLESDSGKVRWTRELDDGDCAGVAVHGNRVVMTGSFLGDFTFLGKTYRASERPDVLDEDAFLAAYTLAGEERWARHFARAGTGVVMDARDGVLVMGHYESGDRVGDTALPGARGSIDNVFVAKLDRIDGELRWVRGIPSEAALALDVAVTREGQGVVVGTFGGPTDFGGGTVRPTGGYDAFILRLEE
jgi:hypothetical protein